jgi:hypothetical protein
MRDSRLTVILPNFRIVEETAEESEKERTLNREVVEAVDGPFINRLFLVE